MYENQEYNIIIGGVRRNITSFETMLSLEPGDINQDIEPLTQLQYLSMLFMNLGYDKCPPDLSFISHNIPIESLILLRSLMNCCVFIYTHRLDYIFIPLNAGVSHFEGTCPLRPCGLVVEPFLT